MRAFAGQLSTHGGHGCAATVWTLAPQYIKSFIAVTKRSLGFFGVNVA